MLITSGTCSICRRVRLAERKEGLVSASYVHVCRECLIAMYDLCDKDKVREKSEEIVKEGR